MSGPEDAAREWGLPDWRDASAYAWPEWSGEDRSLDNQGFEKTDFGTLFKWRWEFSRRRDDLRRAFDARAQDTYSNYCEVQRLQGKNEDSVLHPHQPGFTARSYIEDGFGYAGIPNPRISEQPPHVIHPMLDPPYPGRFYSADKRNATIEISVEQHEAVFVFDLNKPINHQLRTAKRRIDEEQKALKGRQIQKRVRPDLWAIYLRVLDAREGEASWLDIVRILPKSIGSTPHTARDTWKQARALCFNF